MVNKASRTEKNDNNGRTPAAVSNNGHTPSTNGNGRAQQRERERRAARSRNPLNVLRYAHIVGWGMKVPEEVITNQDLEALVDTTDDWIRKGTGIRERRMANDKESVASLGFEAARAALDRADVLPSELELIVVATSTPEDIYPSSASKIQNLLGATRAGAFDLSAACSGFVYGLNMAAQAIRSGSIETAIVIGAEVNSRVMDWSDRTTCILFGDGAGAVVLQARDEPGGLLSCVLGSDGSGADLLGIPTVGYSEMPEGRLLHKLHMNGREVFRFATHIINESVREVVSQAGLALSDISLIIPHQANQRILSAAARGLNVPEEMFYSNVERYGNTSAASIPIALCEAERDKRLKPNDHIVMVGFGGGLTWAAALVQWQVVAPALPVGFGFRLSQGRREAEYIAAFWRTRAMRYFRRVESLLKGSVLENEVKQTERVQRTWRDQQAARAEKRQEKPLAEQTPKIEPADRADKPDKIEKTVAEREKTP